MDRADSAEWGNAPTVALAGLASLAVAMGIGRFAFTPILPMMQDDYRLSVGEGGWLAAAPTSASRRGTPRRRQEIPVATMTAWAVI